MLFDDDRYYPFPFTSDTPYDLATKSQIRAFTEDVFEDDIQEFMEEYGDSYEEAVKFFLDHREDQIRELYNEHWDAEYGCGHM